MTPSPRRMDPPPRSGDRPQAPSAAERAWRQGFFVLSAAMAAAALVDFDAGRFAQGLGSAGACCLVLSLLPRFPLLRMMMDSGQRKSAGDLARVLQEVEKLRAAHPWAQPLNNVGWGLLVASLILRAAGGD